MSRFMYDYRSDHLRRLGQDEAGVELTSGDRRTEGSGGTGQRHYLDAFEIAHQTIVAKPIMRLDQAERLLDTSELGLLIPPKPNPQPIDLCAIGQTHPDPF